MSTHDPDYLRRLRTRISPPPWEGAPSLSRPADRELLMLAPELLEAHITLVEERPSNEDRDEASIYLGCIANDLTEKLSNLCDALGDGFPSGYQGTIAALQIARSLVRALVNADAELGNLARALHLIYERKTFQGARSPSVRSPGAEGFARAKEEIDSMVERVREEGEDAKVERDDLVERLREERDAAREERDEAESAVDTLEARVDRMVLALDAAEARVAELGGAPPSPIIPLKSGPEVYP